MYYNKKKLAVSIMWIVIGAALLILAFAGVTDNEICSGLGGGWLAVGIMQVIRNVKYSTNEEYRQKVDIAYEDERNKYIRMKAWSWSGYIFIIGAAIVTIGLFAAGYTLYGQIVCFCMCTVLALFWISYAVLQRKF